MQWKAKCWYPRDAAGGLAWERRFAFWPHQIQDWWIWLESYEARAVESQFGSCEERRIDPALPASQHDIS